ncbi:MAG: hypothetical protein ACPGIC_07655 [Opitutales bacterium]
MARTTLIWDHRSLRIWRIRGSRAQLLHEAVIASVEDCIAVLEKESKKLKISKLRVYLDLPELDHHLERIPEIAPKLRKQLLEQRKIKLYGDEDRVWVAHEMGLAMEGQHQFYLISSLPNALACAMTAWATRNGIQFEGLFSLPLALAEAGEDLEQEREACMRFHALGEAGYLIARNADGKLLFFSRLDSSQPTAEQLDASARRLLLFLEQEFSVAPRLAEHGGSADSDDARVVARMSRQKVNPSLRLISDAERTRLFRRRLRHRAFAGLSLALIFVVYGTLPLIQKKKTLQLSLSDLAAAIEGEQVAVRAVEQRLLKVQKYRDVILFSEGRETIEEDAPVPSPLLVMLRALCNALPEFVELDSYEGAIDLSNAGAVFTMVGRPLTADLDLYEKIKLMHTGLAKQGWLISEPELTFEEKSGGSRFSSQRGELRKFTLRFTISPKGAAL